MANRSSGDWTSPSCLHGSRRNTRSAKCGKKRFTAEARCMNNTRVIAVVEGHTEQPFVREVLAPWLGDRRVYMSARLVGKPGQKGGVGEYTRAKKDIVALLKQPGTLVTTMFDFY